MKKPLIITIITVIILALIGGGVFWYLKTQKQEPVNNNEPVVNNEGEENGDVGEEIDTSDWLTYRNEEYGFEVKYPSVWYIESPAYGGTLSGSERDGYFFHILGLSPSLPNGDWSVLISVAQKSINDILQDDSYYWNQNWEIKNKSKILINEIYAQQIIWSNESTIIYIEELNKPLTFQIDGNFEKSSEIKQIIYSFKFTN